MPVYRERGHRISSGRLYFLTYLFVGELRQKRIDNCHRFMLHADKWTEVADGLKLVLCRTEPSRSEVVRGKSVKPLPALSTLARIRCYSDFHEFLCRKTIVFTDATLPEKQ